MPISELRRDPVSGDWVVIATERAKRPHAFIRSHRHAKGYVARKGCPFEHPQATGNAPPIIAFDERGSRLSGEEAEHSWFVQVIPNKFPAFTPGVPKRLRTGLFETLSGAGYHELVIMRPHDRHWGSYTAREAEIIFRAYGERFASLSEEPFIAYVAIFHNFGEEAGASLYHPHSQIIAIPAIPPDVQRSFDGAKRYFRAEHRCIHCAIIAAEKREGSRVVLENESFLALCPFASRSAFEIRIFPKRHEPCFGNLAERERRDGGDILRRILKLVGRKLGNPPYNFFIHTAPCRRESEFSFYHWHIEIIPKISIWAGFEIATGIEISTIAPEAAATYLRS
jgi:UDPglucose--hexose-1-phosphate uridylyltransferase